MAPQSEIDTDWSRANPLGEAIRTASTAESTIHWSSGFDMVLALPKRFLELGLSIRTISERFSIAYGTTPDKLPLVLGIGYFSHVQVPAKKNLVIVEEALKAVTACRPHPLHYEGGERACIIPRREYHAGKKHRLCVQAGTEALLSRTDTHVPFSRIQRLIAARMLDSKWNKPCFYLQTRADVTELMGLRHKLSKAAGVKITSNAFFIRALALAATKYPLVVGRFVWQNPEDPAAGAVIRIADNVNVAFAVNSPQGLVVPVIKQAQGKSLAQIATEEKLLTARARSNKLTLDDLEGESIALSNLGAYDIDSFLGIVPPPTSTILAAGKVADTAVPQEGRIVVRRMVSLSLAVDHRVIHGEYAARFLHSLTEQLKNPERWI
jgi:pyruvate/2-oxoglutarate dehydrogenase complex dihydrolipoamide acyltransferase (E2) component